MKTNTNFSSIKEDIKNKNILDIFGNPLVPLSCDEGSLSSIFDIMQSIDTIKQLPAVILNDQKQINLLFQYDPSIYWKQWFPDKHRYNIEIF